MTSHARHGHRVLADLGITHFKPLQEVAHHMLTDVIARHRASSKPDDDNDSCLVALPTSSGKDMLAFSVARAFSGTAIVFHPFKALTAAAKGYGTFFNCSAACFGAGFDFSSTYDIVVAAYEQANEDIVKYVQSCHRRGRLVCVFFNEAHVVLPHVDGDWRDFGLACDLAPKLRYACRFPLVFVVSTATLQHQHYVLLTNEMRLPSFSSVCSASPIRSNLTFSLRVAQNWAQMLHALVAAVLAAPLRVIVFVPAVHLCSVLTDALAGIGRPVFSYHAGLADELKAQTLHHFSSLSSALITTTALSCGVNVADVSNVIVFGECFSTEALLQCGGRAARHGENGCVLFLTSPYYINKMSRSERYGAQQVLRLIQSPDFAAALYACYSP
jgi:superfamily II DNA helicase RecQ